MALLEEQNTQMFMREKFDKSERVTVLRSELVTVPRSERVTLQVLNSHPFTIGNYLNINICISCIVFDKLTTRRNIIPH